MILQGPFGTMLTPRELVVLRLVALGEPYKGIERLLHISESTVKSHLVSVRAKLAAGTNAHAVGLMDDFRPGWRPQLDVSGRSPHG